MSGYDKRPDEGSGAYIERLIRERDEAREAGIHWSETASLRERQRDEARALAIKVSRRRPLTPAEHELLRDWQSATTEGAMAELPVVSSGGEHHAVYADGGPEDGSLYGFSTLCGLTIVDIEAWQEIPGASVSCKRCLRCLASMEEHDAKQHAENRWRERRER